MEKESQSQVTDSQENYLNEKEIQTHDTDESLKEGLKYLFWVFGVAVLVVTANYLYRYVR